jgi:hypothetical protein
MDPNCLTALQKRDRLLSLQATSDRFRLGPVPFLIHRVTLDWTSADLGQYEERRGRFLTTKKVKTRKPVRQASGACLHGTELAIVLLDKLNQQPVSKSRSKLATVILFVWRHSGAHKTTTTQHQLAPVLRWNAFLNSVTSYCLHEAQE